MNRTTQPQSRRPVRRPAWRLAASLAGVALAAPLLASTAPAQAHDVTHRGMEYRKTSSCPCWLGDEWDGTYFKKDRGGEAAKLRIYEGGLKNPRLVGKVEFHPYGEWLWLYDTSANADAFYYKVWYNGRWHSYTGPSGGEYRRIKLRGVDEGDTVTIKVYDRSWARDYVGEISGVA